MNTLQSLLATAIIATPAFITGLAHGDDPLPSWNDARPKAVVAFVERVTTDGSPDFVPCRAHRHLRQRRLPLGGAADVFPGVLRLRPRQGARRRSIPEWKKKEPFASVLKAT